MKIVIVGAGKIGLALAFQLSKENHDITIIDRNPKAVSYASEALDILCIEGNGATTAALLEASADSADLLIAVTASDELNLLCCLIAKKIGTAQTIARVRNPEYEGELTPIAGELGLSMTFNPELECAKEFARNLRTPSGIKTDSFANGRAELLRVKLTEESPISGKSLAELDTVVPEKVLVSFVERGESVIIPDGSFCPQEGDVISLIASSRASQAFFKHLHLKSASVQRVMIVGGGKIAYYLAKQLLASGLRVKIIDKDLRRCEELSESLEKAEILYGDGTEEDFLMECGLAGCDAFISLTGMDEENMLLSMFVRKTFPKIKVLTKVARNSFKNIVDTMDVGTVFTPSQTVSNLICRYARAMQNSIDLPIQTLYKLCGGKVEALELCANHRCAVCGTELMKLHLKKNLLIGCINRNGKIIIPSGRDTIEAGDTVIIVTSVSGINELDDILDKRKG